MAETFFNHSSTNFLPLLLITQGNLVIVVASLVLFKGTRNSQMCKNILSFLATAFPLLVRLTTLSLFF
jgi:hypothetical protein